VDHGARLSRRLTVAGSGCALSLVLALMSPCSPSTAQTPRSIAGLPPERTDGRGADAPFIEYEAESAITDGVIIGPDRMFGTLAAEASGRRAVRLDATGQSVTVILDAPANALTVRASVPDALTCRSGDTTLAVMAGDRRVGRLALTPCYGWFYGDYPFTNDAASGGAHHVYDHARLRLDDVLPTGTRLSLVMDSLSPAPWIVIDLIDVELIDPPAPPPVGAVSVTEFGADPTGGLSSLEAFKAAIAHGERHQRPVWIPPGDYRIEGHLSVDNVALIGAGPWWSVLGGPGVGVFGQPAVTGGSRDVILRDFAIIGEVMDRVDEAPLNGVGGAFNQSLISNLFIQHTKAGLWLDGPFDGLMVTDLRILDQTADAVNFHGGVTGSVVQNTFVRGTGDDGLAMWSHPTPNSGNVFRNNTVIAPVLANGIAIYGGGDITVTDNVIADTVTRGGGLHLGARFDSTRVEGDIRFDRNTVIRSGSIDPVWGHGVGAVWLYALDQPLTGARIRIKDTEILDSTDVAFQVLGKTIDGLTINGARIEGPAAGVLQIRAPGDAVLREIEVLDLRGPAIEDRNGAFRLHDGGGHSGWSLIDRDGRGPAPAP